MPRVRQHSSGFTVIELMIAMAIAGFIIIGVAYLTGRLFTVSREQSQQAIATSTARTSLRRLADTVRDAAPIDCNSDGDIAGAGEQWLQGYADDRLVIYGTVDGDPEPERITFELVGEELIRTMEELAPGTCTIAGGSAAQGVVAGAVVNATDGSQPPFRYINAAGAVLDPASLDPADIARITFSLYIDPDPTTEPAATHLTSLVTPRVGACRLADCGSAVQIESFTVTPSSVPEDGTQAATLAWNVIGPADVVCTGSSSSTWAPTGNLFPSGTDTFTPTWTDTSPVTFQLDCADQAVPPNTDQATADLILTPGTAVSYTFTADDSELVTSIDQGLQAHWSFDEVNASSIRDVSGNGNHGQPFGIDASNYDSSSVPAATQPGNTHSLYLNGTDEYFAHNTVGITGSEERTVSLWIRPRTFGADGYDKSVYAHQNSLNRGGDFVIGTRAGQATVHHNDHGVGTTGSPMSLNTWHHVAAVVPPGATHSSDTLIYVDGLLRATETLEDVPQTLQTEHQRVTPGLFSSDLGNAYYWGNLDEIRVYDRALTASEILELAQGENGSTVARWTVNGPAGAACYGSSDTNQSGWPGTVPGQSKPAEPFGVEQTELISPTETTLYTLSCQDGAGNDAPAPPGPVQLTVDDLGTDFTFAATNTQQLDHSLSQGLRAHWRFFEGHVPTVSDLSGNGYIGTPEGTIPGEAGLSGFQENDYQVSTLFPAHINFETGYDVQFDGSDMHLLSASAGITGSAERTVSMWFKADEFVTDGLSNVLFSHDDHPDSGRDFILGAAQHGGGNQIALAFHGHRVVTNGASLDNNWHHVAVVVPAGATHTNHVRMYIDGIQRGLDVAAGQSRSLLTGRSTVRVGFWNGGSTTAGFKGRLNDIRIYDRALSDNEIVHLATGITGESILRWRVKHSANATCEGSATPGYGGWNNDSKPGQPHSVEHWERVLPTQTTQFVLDCRAADGTPDTNPPGPVQIQVVP